MGKGNRVGNTGNGGCNVYFQPFRAFSSHLTTFLPLCLYDIPHPTHGGNAQNSGEVPPYTYQSGNPQSVTSQGPLLQTSRTPLSLLQSPVSSLQLPELSSSVQTP